MRIELGSVKIDINPVTTSWWFQWLVGVSRVTLRDGNAAPEAIRLLREIMTTKEIEQCLDAKTNLLEIGERIITASSIDTRSMAALYTVTYKAQGYDPSDAGGPCECRECRGSMDEDTLCLFRQEPIKHEDRLMSMLDLDLVSSLWDKPVSLYQLTRERNAAETRGRMAARQAKDKADTNRQIRDDILASHGIH